MFPEQKNKSLFVCAGDISGDSHCAKVLTELKKSIPDINIWGVGGPQMEKIGVKLLANCQSFATVGIIEPVKLLPFFARLRSQIIANIGKQSPDLVLLVDFGGFNIGLAQLLRPKFPQLPIYYFISPQVWASRPWRADVLKKCVNKMLTIFPFEETLYKSQGMAARFVGHPLKQDDTNIKQRKIEFCQSYGLDARHPVIGIFPGSRKREIGDLVPVFLQAIKLIHQERTDVQFVISQANSVLAQKIDQIICRSGKKQLIDNKVVLGNIGESKSIMAGADILWAKSGTTTLEATLLQKPMLICYRANWLSYLIFLIFVQVKYVGWPNLLLGEKLIPELIQMDCRSELIVKYTLDWLDVPGACQYVSSRLAEAKDLLGEGNFAEAAASEILQVIN